MVEIAITLSRAIDQLTLQVSNRDVIEQAAIAGMLNAETLFKEGAADYLVKRLDQMAEILEQGWKRRKICLVIAKTCSFTTLRGITEIHYLDHKFINTSEARRLDGVAGQLQEVFAKRVAFMTIKVKPALR